MKRAQFRGCLLGGACGDALGAKVEFVTQSVTIFRKYGPTGIRDIGMNYNVVGGVTDDTQMTLFTAEGLISALLPILISQRGDKSAATDQTPDSTNPLFEAENYVPAVHQSYLRDHVASLFCCGDSRVLDTGPPFPDISSCVQQAVPALHQSYLRWLKTQGVNCNSPASRREVVEKGWLILQQALHSRRAPGNTCLQALMSGDVGSTRNIINDSKGCGGVMRVAPCALIVSAGFADIPKDQQLQLAFQLACAAAAITHTHASGWLSAGCLSSIILCVLCGDSLERAVEQTITLLKKEPKHKECLRKIEEATKLSKIFAKRSLEIEEKDASALKQELALEHIEMLGEGWVGEEALGISLYCSLISQDDFETAVCYSVNHGGDSDSTGAITGNILGALLRDTAIPVRWSKVVELRDVLQEVSDDLFDVLDPNRHENLSLKYPPAIMKTEDGTDLSTYYKEKKYGSHQS
ncbi:hypothetical protein MPTK1_6g06810 [Marchantia polymorpha subsp. ruderalis]|uniref:ADP-ribosylhydrolase ARH3 n=2 Tax=Marchantia polymorpha TaxID=3197 RepID=A0AAF6BPA0_MARPO|nr:hypothetical protein MARPO_0173s0026 [Marchantia polymorpha]BBN13834.1 hypothetical protein Mp_6g06810 [Marchantia polymorpha subsp. ruderalis]|eukprot:PTQ28123.1 hypothetical protein MARPO_0173s0026 [Marchantia polymorpha]